MSGVVERNRRVTRGELLVTAAAELRAVGIDSARLDAELLLAHARGVSRSRLLAELDRPSEGSETDSFAALLARRCRREPLAYIVGRREFWSLDLEVTPDVLIPRPETELLVETALRFLRSLPDRRPRIADVGTGSGCIALALARELPGAELWATDASAAALRVARRNARAAGVEARLHFTEGDLLAPLAGAPLFDLIAANPPYVSSLEAGSLQPEVTHEPRQALFSGSDGLTLTRRLLAQAPALLKPEGRLLVELGQGQTAAARDLARAAGFGKVEVREDLAGIPRLLMASRGGG
jgi:release factor glutamine methyltransferase